MTSDDYAAKSGLICPFCGSDELEGGEINIDSGIVWQTVSCLTCDKEWHDNYNLVGYTEIS